MTNWELVFITLENSLQRMEDGGRQGGGNKGGGAKRRGYKEGRRRRTGLGWWFQPNE